MSLQETIKPDHYPNPNHHKIALNSARVIEDFSKALEKMKDEKIALIEWLKGTVSQCHDSNNSHTLAMRSAYKHVLRQMGVEL